MGMPSGGCEIVGCSFLPWMVKFVRHRMILSVFTLALMIVSSCMVAFVKHNNSARLAGLYLIGVSPVVMVCAFSCFQSNTAGHTKKVTTTAIYLIGYCVGNLIGPQTFVTKQAPGYIGGKIAMVACYSVAFVLVCIIYLNYYLKNKKKEKLVSQMDLSDFKAIQNSEFADLTDIENPTFKYCL